MPYREFRPVDFNIEIMNGMIKFQPEFTIDRVESFIDPSNTKDKDKAFGILITTVQNLISEFFDRRQVQPTTDDFKRELCNIMNTKFYPKMMMIESTEEMDKEEINPASVVVNQVRKFKPSDIKLFKTDDGYKLDWEHLYKLIRDELYNEEKVKKEMFESLSELFPNDNLQTKTSYQEAFANQLNKNFYPTNAVFLRYAEIYLGEKRPSLPTIKKYKAAVNINAIPESDDDAEKEDQIFNSGNRSDGDETDSVVDPTFEDMLEEEVIDLCDDAMEIMIDTYGIKYKAAKHCLSNLYSPQDLKIFMDSLKMTFEAGYKHNEAEG